MRSTGFSVGEPAPWFHCRTQLRERFSFSSIAGRYVVLSFLGSAAHPAAIKILQGVNAHRARFDDHHACFFGVCVDPADEQLKRVDSVLPGIRYIWDFDQNVSRLYGALQADGRFRQVTYVLDPALRIVAILPLNCGPTGEPEDEPIKAILRILDRLPPLAPTHAALPQAPVLIVPHVFEPALCTALIDYYVTHDSQESGFMVERSGKTVLMSDPQHKQRRDCTLTDEALRNACARRIHSRLIPQISQAFQFTATRIERYLLACYSADEGGHFRPHRDNTTQGTAHRRFAVSLFLNAGEYAGGALQFPEFGRGLYSAPTGGAVVFSCSLLHQAMPVTQGQRYMFLPFLYDEAARLVREKNRPFLHSC
ncbi:MAG: redoxin domain-containing protein [Pseudomonas sp.]